MHKASNKEREAMLKALQQSESIFSRYYLNEQFNDIIFDFKLIDNVLVGDPFRFGIDNLSFNSILPNYS